MIHTGIEPTIDAKLPKEQSGLHHGRSIMEQATSFAQDVKHSFQANEKAGVVLLDLTAAL